MAAQARERDRLAALEARTMALRTLPVAALTWLVVVVFVRSELVLRVVTLAAIVLSVMVAGRSAVTARSFLHRWGDPDARRPPPMWVTLVAVAGAVATFVAGANVAADVDAGRSTLRATAFATTFLAVTLAAVYAHVAGARGLSQALHAPSGGETLPAGGAPMHALGTRPTPVRPDAGTVPEDADDRAAARRLVAAAMTELRLLMASCPPVRPAGPVLDAGRLVADFHRSHPREVVAAHAELVRIRSLLPHERTLAQVVTLLGCPYHPPDDGLSYTVWVARLDVALASELANDVERLSEAQPLDAAGGSALTAPDRRPPAAG